MHVILSNISWMSFNILLALVAVLFGWLMKRTALKLLRVVYGVVLLQCEPVFLVSLVGYSGVDIGMSSGNAGLAGASIYDTFVIGWCSVLYHVSSFRKGRVQMTTVEQSSVVLPADWVPGPKQGFWTYDDYAKLPDDGNRYEIVDGVLVMTPAPTPEHQDIAGMIYYYLVTHVKLAGFGRVFPGPVDVVLGSNQVFQPDVVVLLNGHLDRVGSKKINGAPDLMVEIASPSTAAYDRLMKYEKYAQAGIPEYWIVKPVARTVEVLVLEHGKYRSLGVFSGRQTLPSQIAPNLPVYVEQFFS